MKTPSEVIPKFIISLEKDKERDEYLKKDVFPKISNYIKCKAFDGEIDNPNPFFEENNLYAAEHFIEKCNSGQLGCFISHYNVWKYIVANNLDIAIVMEDDIKIYKNFNRIVNTIYENLPVKFDYVHLFIHPDKQKIEYLEGNEGDIIPAEDNFGTVAYIISLRGARRLIKLTKLLKIQAPVDRQINFYIQHHFLKAYMIKKPFLITQGEIMPNRAIYNNSFKSNIWYSTKLAESKIVDQKYIKPAGFSEEELVDLDKEIETHKNNIKPEPTKPEPTKPEEIPKDEPTNREIEITKTDSPKLNTDNISIPQTEEVKALTEEIQQEDNKNEEDQIVSSIIEKLASID